MSRRTKQKQNPQAVDYIAAWRKLIDETADPRTLLGRWLAERDQRDDLMVRVAQRLEMLRLIASEYVNDGPPAP